MYIAAKYYSMKFSLFIALFTLFSFTSLAQIELPPASPTFTVSGSVGLAKASVTYSRPSARERKIFGEIVPYGELWRTGANQSTRLSFDLNVIIEGHEVPAGEYALYTIPGEKTWTIIISKNTSWWGVDGYDQNADLVRFEVPAKTTSSHYETFTISFSDFTTNSAYLNLKWEKSKVKFKIENKLDSYVMSQIEDKLIKNTPTNPGDYYSGASYYYRTERDSVLALQWVNKSIDDQPTYWKLHLKAKLLVRLNKKEEAIEAARASIKLAEGGVNPDYVRLNNKLIEALD